VGIHFSIKCGSFILVKNYYYYYYYYSAQPSNTSKLSPHPPPASSHNFENPCVQEFGFLHLQPLTNSHLDFLIIVETTIPKMFFRCSFYKNEEVEIPIRKWLRIEGPNFVQEIIFLNSCQGGINASTASICPGIVMPVCNQFSSVQFSSCLLTCRVSSHMASYSNSKT
jgi:hypothetical protein